jgi:hypothetical protein
VAVQEGERAFRAGGIVGFRKWQLQRLLEQQTTQYVSPIELAMLYGRIGERDRAIVELTKAFDQHASGLIWLKLEPRFDPLRTDARFQQILAKMNLKE